MREQCLLIQEPLDPLQTIQIAEEELVAGNGAGAAKDCSQGGAS